MGGPHERPYRKPHNKFFPSSPLQQVRALPILARAVGFGTILITTANEHGFL